MAVIYRCDTCGKIVEKDEDIVKMKFYVFSMKEGMPDKFSDFVVNKIMCRECMDKILNFGNNEKEEL